MSNVKQQPTVDIPATWHGYKIPTILQTREYSIDNQKAKSYHSLTHRSEVVQYCMPNCTEVSSDIDTENIVHCYSEEED